MTTVAFLVDQLFSTAPGGMGTYVRELIPALSRTDPSLDIVLFHARFPGPPGLPGPAGGDGEDDSVDSGSDRSPQPERWMRGYWVEELPRSIRRLYPWWALARRPPLPDSLSSRDVLHSPVVAAVPPAGPGQRLVVTVHDLAFVVHPELFPKRWRLAYRAGLRRAVRSADALIAISRHTAEDLVRHTRIDRRKVHVVPLAAALPPSDAPVDEVLARLKVPRPYFLFVGTLEPRKNLVRLVRAYRRVAARGSRHALVLTGPMGWHSNALLAELSAEARGRVLLTGSVSADDLDALYRGAGAFVYPSLYEGFGLPVVEAMIRGVPCVISTSSSLPEVAGDAALMVDPRSVAGLAEAMERITAEVALAGRLRRAGPERAARFTWAETARLTLDVYKSIL